MRIPRLTSRFPGPNRGAGAGMRGIALIEFALILPVIIIMAMGIIDFGRLIQTRLIVSNVSREGGSIASRQTTIDNALISMLQASGTPLNMRGAAGALICTRITAGQTLAQPAPKITTQLYGGGLARGSIIGANNMYLGLPQNLYNHLVFKQANSTSDISEITVVEVYFKYRPITPLPNFIQGMLLPDNGGMIIGSRAIF